MTNIGLYPHKLLTFEPFPGTYNAVQSAATSGCDPLPDVLKAATVDDCAPAYASQDTTYPGCPELASSSEPPDQYHITSAGPTAYTARRAVQKEPNITS